MKTKSFTLMELLISMAVFAVIIVLVGSIFRGALFSWRQSQESARNYQVLKYIFRSISREVSSSLDVDRKLIPPEAKIFAGTNKSLFFIYPEQDFLSEVGYIFMPQEKTLIKRRAVCDFDFNTFDSEDKIGLNIEDMSFTYFDGENWVESLEDIPCAVAIELNLSFQGKAAVFKEVINIPTGK